MKSNKIIPQLQIKAFLKLGREWEGSRGEDANGGNIRSWEQDISYSD